MKDRRGFTLLETLLVLTLLSLLGIFGVKLLQPRAQFANIAALFRSFLQSVADFSQGQAAEALLLIGNFDPGKLANELLIFEKIGGHWQARDRLQCKLHGDAWIENPKIGKNFSEFDSAEIANFPTLTGRWMAIPLSEFRKKPCALEFFLSTQKNQQIFRISNHGTVYSEELTRLSSP